MEQFKLRESDEFIKLGQVLKSCRTGRKWCGSKRGHTKRTGSCQW